MGTLKINFLWSSLPTRTEFYYQFSLGLAADRGKAFAYTSCRLGIPIWWAYSIYVNGVYSPHIIYKLQYVVLNSNIICVSIRNVVYGVCSPYGLIFVLLAPPSHSQRQGYIEVDFPYEKINHILQIQINLLIMKKLIMKRLIFKEKLIFWKN